MLCLSRRELSTPLYMSRKIRKLRKEKFDATDATHINDWFPAVYMSCVSQHFRLFHVSNLSFRNFWFFLLMYPGSSKNINVVFERSRPRCDSSRSCVGIDVGKRVPKTSALRATLFLTSGIVVKPKMWDGQSSPNWECWYLNNIITENKYWMGEWGTS